MKESLSLFSEMSPYLLLGFFFAGILHVCVSLDAVARHLGRSNIGSVVKAVVFGIPLPLCSCGVIPSAVMLKRKGASHGAVVSFLIATPITGIDSIFATYSLMGLVFAIFRVIASSVTALVAGILTNIFDFKHEDLQPGETCPHCVHESKADEDNSAGQKAGSRIKELFSYAFIQLLGDIWKWLIIGIIIAGIISYAIPDAFIQQHLGSSWQSMLVMLVIGIPMYVCSTGSIPIAASLMMKGMSPGAALVFLLAGPATNAVTITIVSKEIGRRATILYVATIAGMSILLGIVLNLVWNYMGAIAPHAIMHQPMLHSWINISSSFVLACLVIINIIRTLRHKNWRVAKKVNF